MLRLNKWERVSKSKVHIVTVCFGKVIFPGEWVFAMDSAATFLSLPARGVPGAKITNYAPLF